MNGAKYAVHAACALAALAASAAGVNYEGRFLDASGTVQSNVTVRATLSAYATEDASQPFATRPITISTDGAGQFSATAEEMDTSAVGSTFWIGVTPEGHAEIRPRMRVSPVPFALVAAVAERVETSGEAAFTRDVMRVDEVAPGAHFTAGNATLKGSATVQGDVQGAQTVYLNHLDLSGGAVKMLRANSPDNITTRWSDFAADREMSLRPSASERYPSDKLDITAEDDGFAIVLIQVPPLNAINAGDVSATLSNGDFAVFENAHLPVCVDLDDCWAFMLPVRKASHLVLTLRITGSMGWVSQLVSASAKVKMVYAGAN